jgi:hypothetical protein
MNRTQATTAIANAIMSNVPTVIMPGDSREWVSISKTRKAFMDWNNRFFAELDRALQLVAVEIEGKRQAEVRAILLRTFNAVWVRAASDAQTPFQRKAAGTL